MVIITLWVLVLWTEVASALEGLRTDFKGLGHIGGGRIMRATVLVSK